MNKREISWPHIKVVLDTFLLGQYTKVVGIARGGLPPAVYLTKRAQIPLYVWPTAADDYSRSLRALLLQQFKPTDRVLFVDEIVCEGRTYAQVAELMDAGSRARWDFLTLFLDDKAVQTAFGGKRPANLRDTALSSEYAGSWVSWPWEPASTVNVGDRSLARDVYTSRTRSCDRHADCDAADEIANAQGTRAH